MKISNLLIIISSILTLAFILFLFAKNLGTSCFNLIDYVVSFTTLFGNLGISILATLGL